MCQTFFFIYSCFFLVRFSTLWLIFATSTTYLKENATKMIKVLSLALPVFCAAFFFFKCRPLPREKSMKCLLCPNKRKPAFQGHAHCFSAGTGTLFPKKFSETALWPVNKPQPTNLTVLNGKSLKNLQKSNVLPGVSSLLLRS